MYRRPYIINQKTLYATMRACHFNDTPMERCFLQVGPSSIYNHVPSSSFRHLVTDLTTLPHSVLSNIASQRQLCHFFHRVHPLSSLTSFLLPSMYDPALSHFPLLLVGNNCYKYGIYSDCLLQHYDSQDDDTFLWPAIPDCGTRKYTLLGHL